MIAEEPTAPPRAERLGNHVLVFVLLALPVLVLLVWWAAGLRTWEASATGFSERLVSFNFQDTNLEDALLVLRPGASVYFSDPSVPMIISFKVRDMPEQQALSWIVQLSETSITLKGDRIDVLSPPWWERSYRWVDEWTRRHGGVRLWSNR